MKTLHSVNNLCCGTSSISDGIFVDDLSIRYGLGPNYSMTHIQSEIQTSVPTKRSLVIMLKPGHLGNVTIEPVHQQDHHLHQLGLGADCVSFSRCLLTYSFSMERCSTMYRGTSWSNFPAAPGSIWHLASGIWL